MWPLGSLYMAFRSSESSVSSVASFRDGKLFVRSYAACATAAYFRLLDGSISAAPVLYVGSTFSRVTSADSVS